MKTKQMKTYKFNVSNPWLVFPTLIFSFFAGVKLSFYFQDLGLFSDNKIIYSVLSIILVVFFFIFMLWLIAFAKIEVTINEDIISIKWIRQFLFNQKKDMELPFDGMATYVTEPRTPWDYLKINMLNGEDHKLWNLGTSDNFSNFVKAFVSAVNNYNKKIKENSTKNNLRDKPKTIERKYTIY